MALSTRDKRLMAVALCVVLVAGVGYFLFGRGGGGSQTPHTITVPTGPIATPSASPTPGQSGNGKLVFSGRDPFQPLVDLNGSSTSGTTGSVAPASPPPPAPTGGSSTSVNGHTVVLLDVFSQNGDQMAQVEVDGTVYTVKEGETFATDFQLVSVNGSCADFTDNGDSFSLCQSTGK